MSTSLIEMGITDIEMVCAAILHDTVEDTKVTNEDIIKEFGDGIADLVYWLTDVSKPADGNRAQRKELDRMHADCAPADAQTIKLADLIDNSKSILEHDPKFAKVYMAEKELLLDVLHKGSPTLMVKARAIVSDYKTTKHHN